MLMYGWIPVQSIRHTRSKITLFGHTSQRLDLWHARAPGSRVSPWVSLSAFGANSRGGRGGFGIGRYTTRAVQLKTSAVRTGGVRIADPHTGRDGRGGSASATFRPGTCGVRWYVVVVPAGTKSTGWTAVRFSLYTVPYTARDLHTRDKSRR